MKISLRSVIACFRQWHRHRFLWLGVLVVALCAEPGGSAAFAQAAREVLIPISFTTAGAEIRTSACLTVTELVLQPADHPLDAGLPTIDRALQSVLEAIRSKDKAVLLQLSDPILGRDPKRFEEQANLYFAQFEKMKLTAVSRAYQLDGLVVLLASFTFEGHPLTSALVFSEHQDGSVFFLPYETDLVTYRLLEQWLFAKWGPVTTNAPSYCPADTAERATHRIALAASDIHSSFVYLKGAPVNVPGALAGPVSRVQSTIKAIDTAISSSKMDDYFSLLPEATRAASRKAYNDANSDARAQLRDSILRQQPFFVFDEYPLLIAYTKTPAGTVQVMYFTADTQGGLVWTNAQRLTLADRVFKFGPLYEVSKLSKPFSSIATGQDAAAVQRTK